MASDIKLHTDGRSSDLSRPFRAFPARGAVIVDSPARRPVAGLRNACFRDSQQRVLSGTHTPFPFDAPAPVASSGNRSGPKFTNISPPGQTLPHFFYMKRSRVPPRKADAYTPSVQCGEGIFRGIGNILEPLEVRGLFGTLYFVGLTATVQQDAVRFKGNQRPIDPPVRTESTFIGLNNLV